MPRLSSATANLAMLTLAAFTVATGCSGGGTSAPAVMPSPTATPTPTAAPQSLKIVVDSFFPPSAGPVDALMLVNTMAVDVAYTVGSAVVTDAGTGATLAGATWSTSNANIAIEPSPTGFIGGQRPAPVNGILVGGSAYGGAILTAHVGTASASIPVVYFPSIPLGCDGNSVGYAFDSGTPQPVAGMAGSDAYVRACSPSPSDATFHFPYGATILSDGNVDGAPVASGARRSVAFPFVVASAWRSDFTEISAAALSTSASPCGSSVPCAIASGDIILFKTAAGRIVKYSFSASGNDLVGAYEISDLSPAFSY